MALAATGARNGLSTGAFDRWFRYPAGFSPTALARCMDAVDVADGGTLLDPFVGAGTTAIAALDHGIRFAGLEAHPEIAELAQLKLSAAPATDEINRVSKTVGEAPAASDAERRATPGMIQKAFSPAVGRDLIGMRDTIRAHSGVTWTLAKWALLATLREVARVKVGWPYQRPNQSRRPSFSNPRERFEVRLRWMHEDLVARGEADGASVRQGDAREKESWDALLEGQSVDGCCTSPPYLNNFDYADATRLELYFWGDLASWAEMCTEVRSGMVVASTQQTSRLAAEEALADLKASFPRAGTAIQPLITKLSHERSERPRGKEYDSLASLYFRDMGDVLIPLFSALRPGSNAVFVVGDSAPYGVFVDTPGLIGKMAEEVGFEVAANEHLRDRGLRWRTNGTRHQVLLSERLLTLRAPKTG